MQSIHVQTWNAVTYTIVNDWKGRVWVWGNHWVGVEDGGILLQKHTWQLWILKCFVASSDQDSSSISNEQWAESEPWVFILHRYYYKTTWWYGNVNVPLQGSRINQSKLQRSNAAAVEMFNSYMHVDQNSKCLLLVKDRLVANDTLFRHI